MGSFTLAIRNLRRRRLRFWLTILSIALSVTAFVSMVSVTQAIDYSVFSATSEESIGHNAGFPDFADIVVYEANSWAWGGIRLSKLPASLVNTISDIPSVDYAVPRVGPFRIISSLDIISKNGTATRSHLIILCGIDPLLENRLRQLKDSMWSGEYLQPGDKDSAIMGRRLAEALQVNVGDTVVIPSGVDGLDGGATVTQMRLYIKGIFDSPYEDGDLWIYTSINAMRELVGLSNQTVTRIAVRVKEPLRDNLQLAAVAIAGLPSVDPFIPAITPTGASALAVRTTQVTHLQVVSISLIVAAVVTCNAMIMSIYERIREIGVLSVTGAETWDILKIFVFESLMIGLVGGILGYAIATFGSVLYNSVIASNLHMAIVPPKLDALWAMVAVALGVVVSVFSSLVPSQRAASMEPIQVIQKEMGMSKAAGLELAWLSRRSYVATLAFRNIARRKLRSILSVLGISIGIALLVSLMIASAGLVYTLKSLGLVTTGVESYHFIVAFLCIMVGGLGTTNSMLTSILERTREIGIKMAVGARSRDVMTEILVESTVMGLIGGLVGVVLGLVISIGPQIAIIEVAVPISFWLYVFSVALGSLAFAVIVSVAAGLYPAYRAARMEPVEAFAYVW